MELTFGERIGGGIEGDVWVATDNIGRKIAVKFFKGSEPENIEKTAHDHATALSRINHPAVVRVLALEPQPHPETDGDQLAVLMEFVSGVSLYKYTSTLTVAHAANIVKNICEGVEAFHSNGLVHGDLHDGNVMITASGAKLVDLLYTHSLASVTTSVAEKNRAGDIRDLAKLAHQVYSKADLGGEALERAYLVASTADATAAVQRAFQAVLDASIETSVSADKLFEKFRAWSARDLGEYRPFGFERDLSIEHLMSFKAKFENSKSEFEVIRLLESEGRTFLLTGPGGAGKSIALRAIGYKQHVAGHTVLRVRLKTLVTMHSEGRLLADSLASYVSERIGVTQSEGAQVVRNLSLLLFDGLDEVVEHSIALIREIQVLCFARGDLRVVIGSRPGALRTESNEFKVATILSLDDFSIDEQLQALLTDSGATQDEVIQAVQKLSGLRKSLRLSNTPLNVLLACAVARLGDAAPTTVSSLFEAVVNILQRQPLTDGSTGSVNPTQARMVLQYSGWLLRHNANTVYDRLETTISTALASLLGGKSQSRLIVSYALSFWEAKGILFRTSALGSVQIDFVHEMLTAFAAAEYLVQIASDADRTKWWASHGRNPQHVDIVAFCAELEGAQAADDIASTSSSAANGTLGEIKLRGFVASLVGDVGQQLSTGMPKAVGELLLSDNPAVAKEAALAAIPLAPFAKDEFAEQARRALAGPADWNELAALNVLVSLGVEHTPTDRLIEVVRATAIRREERVPESRPSDPVTRATLESALLIPAIDLIVAAGRRSEIESAIREHVAEGHSVSAREHQQLMVRLARWGVPEFADEYEKKYHQLESASRIWDPTPHYAADLFFISLLVKMAEPNRPVREVVGYEHLGKLIHGLEVFESAANEWNAGLFKRGAPVEAVLRGTILAYGLSIERIIAEARGTIGTIIPTEKPPSNKYYEGLFGIRVETPATPNWEQAAASLDSNILADALDLPSGAFANIAAKLLCTKPEAELAREIERVLSKRGSLVVDIVAGAASELFGDRAHDVLVTELNKGISSEVAPLLTSLARIGGAASSAGRKLLISSLQSHCGSVVIGAAEGFTESTMDENIEKECRLALDSWLQWSDPSKSPLQVLPCGVVVCGTNLFAKEVAASLLTTLARASALTYEELVGWTRDPYIGPAAIKLIVENAAKSIAECERVIASVEESTLDEHALGALLSSEGVDLSSVAPRLIAFASSNNKAIRYALACRIGAAKWLDKEQLQSVCDLLKNDPEPAIRREAHLASTGQQRRYAVPR